MARSLKMSGRAKSEEHKAKIANIHKARIGKHDVTCSCALCVGYKGKLTNEQRIEIRKRCDGTKISRIALAQEFHVSMSTIIRTCAVLPT